MAQLDLADSMPLYQQPAPSIHVPPQQDSAQPISPSADDPSPVSGASVRPIQDLFSMLKGALNAVLDLAPMLSPTSNPPSGDPAAIETTLTDITTNAIAEDLNLTLHQESNHGDIGVPRSRRTGNRENVYEQRISIGAVDEQTANRFNTSNNNHTSNNMNTNSVHNISHPQSSLTDMMATETISNTTSSMTTANTIVSTTTALIPFGQMEYPHRSCVDFIRRLLGAPGATELRISSLPARSLHPTEVMDGLAFGQDTCAICLDGYLVDNRVRVLGCKHVFHTACIDPWLRRGRPTCPLCQTVCC